MAGATAVALPKASHKTRYSTLIPAWDAKRLGLRITQTQCDGKSEYQTSYTKWPFQRPRTNIKPESNHLEVPPTLCDMDMQTTYKCDFIPHEAPKKDKKKDYAYRSIGGTMLTDTTYKVDFSPKMSQMTESFKTHKEYSAPVTKFKGKSVYQMSYQPFEPEMAKQCRPSPIRPAECIRAEDKDKETPASTFRLDYQVHANTEKRKPIKPEENNQLSKEPLDATTSYKQFFTKKDLPPYAKKVLNTNCVVIKSMLPECMQPQEAPQKEPQGDAVNAQPATAEVPKEDVKEPDVPPGLITTFTADFRPHYNVKRRTNCKPAESGYHFIDAPFDGKTTQGTAYKPWPVAFPEKPQWARKPEYKRPQTWMQTHSTYAADFKHPGTSVPPSPIKVKNNQDIIRHVASGDAGIETTYQNNYKGVSLDEVTKSFLVKQVYVPPKEKMICQSTQRAHYTGHHSERVKLWRQVSEHRGLCNNKTMAFDTTYKDTYKDHRPKSCPANVILSRALQPNKATDTQANMVVEDLETENTKKPEE